ncbi:MAG: HDIG domain-containing protein, partial [Lentisphaeria bacterium]|nr:HDIG domain-containing protein [Lentisphaeria bacterium]
MGDKPLIDPEALDAMLERSRIPAVVMLVLVWAVASVLLILSWNRQQLLLDWVIGQSAPYSIKSPADFSYTDTAATDRKRREARETEPDFFRLDRQLTKNITDNINDFFVLIENRMADAANRRNHAVAGSLPVTVVAKASPALTAALNREYHKNDNYPIFRNRLNEMLYKGILGAPGPAAAKVPGAVRPGRSRLRVIDTHDRVLDGVFPRGGFPTVPMAAEILASLLFPSDPQCRNEFRPLLAELIGRRGNLNLDETHTLEARKAAAAAVKPVIMSRSEGSMLIRKGERYTREKRDMIAAAMRAKPSSGLKEAYSQMVWSFVIVLAAVAFMYIASPDIRRDNLRILLAGLTVSIALVANYEAIKFFNYLLIHDIVRNEQLVLAAVPVALGTVMLAVMLDCRTAVSAGGVIAVVTSMMIMPTRSLEIALRWVAVSSLAAVLVRNVLNYRSFFVRTALGVFVLTWAINLIDILSPGVELKLAEKLWNAAWVIFCNGLFCAMAALALLFIFELVFNLSTNMALMVLSDCNHPLLERLKREAPGTMAHSMAVATLAEDAARAIGANPLRAKAGALFHDIGKLSMPQYFTENNPESGLLHRNLNPQMSSIIIRDHVKEGLALARQHRLCRYIRGVIGSHHGDDLVRFFYRQALEEHKADAPPVLEEQFRYHGAPPKSREEGIINLADACEAASRSLKHPTPENITEMVRNIIRGRFTGGQLRNCHLTTADLELVEKSFIASLSSGMHGRVA